MLAALFLLSFQFGMAEQVSFLPKPNDYVNDFARVLSADAAAKLNRICAELDHSRANAQVAVVIVRNLDGEDAADWANELENKWQMGKKGSDRGVLVLLAVDDHKYRIDVGYGLEGILNDGKIGDIGRSMVPALRARDYDAAVIGSVGQLADVIAEDAHVTLTDHDAVQKPNQHSYDWKGDVFFVVWACLFFGLLTLRIIFGPRGKLWGIPWSISISGLDDSGSGSGGSGFGGFGGGSFGGGGAGGSW
jgi:uncharacterized protein